MNATLEKKAKTKSYFVKDESLHGVDNDRFNYADIAHVLDETISTNEPPYNIAIIGKWGLGKSSLINLVTEKYKKDSDHYQVQEINAWKYEKESLRKVFLKQLWQGISEKKVQSFETVKKELTNIITADLPPGDKKTVWARSKRFWLTLGLLILLTIVAFIIYKLVQAGSWTVLCDISFWKHVFLRYCKNISTLLIGPALVALCKLLFDDYHAKRSNRVELNFPIETTDDYEIFLETNIKEQLKNKPDLKIITVIDDLDRLSIDKIVEALDALKAFVGFERCIFIVPFDDEIIKRALDKRRAQEFKEQAEITEVIESELILDKLFQFKIYLPPILDFDIQQYACSLAKQEVPDFLNCYCEEQLMQKVIERVLIYPGVTTPRQVKKLLNAFINNMMIASARESSGKIQHGLLTSEDGVYQIAKLSVLQADFNNFYDLLFKDMRCIDLILEAHRGSKTRGELPDFLQLYFEDNDNGIVLKDEHEQLLNFLSRTAKYRVDNIAPYLYLAQDDISIQTGDELQRRAVNAMKSGNARTLQELLAGAKDLAKGIPYHLARASNDLPEMLNTVTHVYDDVDTEYQTAVAQKIIERTLELDLQDVKFLYHVPASVILSIADNGENNAFNEQYLEKYLTVLAKDDWFEETALTNAMKELLSAESLESDTLKGKMKAICDLCLQKDSLKASTMFTFVDPQSKNFAYYWGIEWFKKLCNFMENENDFSENVTNQAINAFVELSKTVAIDLLTRPLVDLTQYASFLNTLDTMLNHNIDENSGRTVKDIVPQSIATQIANNVITHDFSQHGKLVCKILSGLQYVVNDDNSEDFDEFTLNYEDTSALDKILIYCGEKDYLALLSKTIDSLTTAVFSDGSNDDLLANTVGYFSEDQLEEFGTKFVKASSYKSSHDYSRELTVLRIIVPIEGMAEQFEPIANQLMSQMSSYSGYEQYREYVSDAMGCMKDVLNQTVIDKYVSSIVSRFSSYRKYCLEALDRVTMKMSATAFKPAFDKIIANSEASDFNLALDIIENHKAIRPDDNTSLTGYVDFLLKNLPNTEKPDRVMRILRQEFSRIPSPERIITNGIKNQKCDTTELAKTEAYFVDAYDDIEDVSDVFRKLCVAGVSGEVLSRVVTHLKKHSKDSLYLQMINELDDVAKAQELETYVEMACGNIDVANARIFLLSCLQNSFKQVNNSECSISIVEKIKQHETYFKNQKEDTAAALREGFTTTTSDVLKKSILATVSGLRIKPQFKKGLGEEDLDYYKKWMK